jgi:hypothetical protein
MTAAEPSAAAAETKAAARESTPRWLRLFRGRRGAAIVYVVFAATYVGTAGGRVVAHSPYNHYVYLADGWLHGRLALPGQPPNENDWAKVDVLKLRDGRELRGIYGSRTGGPVDRFYPLRGAPETVPGSEIVTRTSIRYVSFPPFPAVLMAPFVAIWGLAFNDVLFNALWAGLNPMLLFLLLRHLRTRGLSQRSEVDDLWLTALFGVGTVYYFCSVLGQVWFSAQIVAVTLSIGFVWASLGARRPLLAGLFAALGFATRPPWLVIPLFVFEAAGTRCVPRRAGARSASRCCSSRRRSRWSAPSSLRSTSRASVARSSSGTSSWRCSGRSGCFASASSTTTSSRATSPPRWSCSRG